MLKRKPKDKDILIDRLYLQDPPLGCDARDLIDLLNDEPIIHVSHVLIKCDWEDRDGEPVGIRLGTKPGKDEEPAVVYTRTPFDSAKVLKSLQDLHNG